MRRLHGMARRSVLVLAVLESLLLGACTKEVPVEARLPPTPFDLALVGLGRVDSETSFPVLAHTGLISVAEAGLSLESAIDEADELRLVVFAWSLLEFAAEVGLPPAEVLDRIQVVDAVVGARLPPSAEAWVSAPFGGGGASAAMFDAPAVPGTVEAGFADLMDFQLRFVIGPPAGTDSGTDMGPLGTDATPGSDAASGADAGTDAGSDSGPVVLGPFGVPTMITGISAAGENAEDPTFTDDLLELYFNSDRAGCVGGRDIWVSARPTSVAPWGAASCVTELNTTAEDAHPFVSGDGLVMFLASNRAGGLGGRDIWMSTRATDTWSTPVHVPELSSSEDDSSPSLSADGLEIIFVSGRSPSLSVRNLWRSSRSGVAAPWTLPVHILELSTSAYETGPDLSTAGLDLHFASTRGGGVGGFDIWTASRPGTGSMFGVATNVASLNTSFDDQDPALSPDLRYIIFTSERDDPNGRLYEAFR